MHEKQDSRACGPARLAGRLTGHCCRAASEGILQLMMGIAQASNQEPYAALLFWRRAGASEERHGVGHTKYDLTRVVQTCPRCESATRCAEIWGGGDEDEGASIDWPLCGGVVRKGPLRHHIRPPRGSVLDAEPQQATVYAVAGP